MEVSTIIVTKKLMIVSMMALFLVFTANLFAAGAQEQPEEQAPEPQQEIPEQSQQEQLDVTPPQNPSSSDPDYEQVKPQIEKQLVQEAQNRVITGHLQELRSKAEVQTFPEQAGGDDIEAVVASVNGSEIANKDYLANLNQQMQQYVSMGLDPNSEQAEAIKEQIRPQILESLVNVSLVTQQAEAENISPDTQQVEAQYQSFAAQFGGEQALEEQLDAEGMTKQDLMDDIIRQMSINEYLQQYIEEHADPSDFEFSDEQIRQRYEQLLTQQQQQQQ